MDRRTAFGLILLCLPAFGRAWADEIRLKDGSKLSGKIVGYENDSFKIETSYGFAYVRKDKVANIIPSAEKKEPEAKGNPPVPATQPVAVTSDAPHAVVNAPNPSASASTPVGAKTAAAEKTIPPPGKVTVVPAPTPVVPPEPPVIRDEVRGNLYVNHSYGFQMYKPPSWSLIPAARKSLPDAVAALGTGDQATLLIIGREKATETIEAHANVTAKKLGEVYENYRESSNRVVIVTGLRAIERRARGTADGKDWSVTVLTVAHGNDMFTLLGMTWADSDLIQVQENVIAKVANTLTFTTPE